MSYKHVLFWVYLSEVWQVLTSCYLRHQRWFFFSMFEMVQMQILFQFLQGWRLQHNWNMRNAFMFDCRHGVEAYMKNLKNNLMWNFWILEHMGIISLSAYLSFLLASEDVPLSI